MTLEFLVERWEDQRTIKNLMGKYVNCLLLNRQGEIFDSFFSKKADVCLRSCCKSACRKSSAASPMKRSTALVPSTSSP